MSGQGARRPRRYPPGEAQLPSDFGERLARLKERAGLTWEAMAEALGVDTRQLFRWRHGSAPSGRAMLALLRLAAQVPDGLSELLSEDRPARARSERRR